MTKKFIFIVSIILIFLHLHANTEKTQADTAGKAPVVPVCREDNLLNPQMKWEVWDNPGARKSPSQWRLQLTELSGIKNEQNKASSLLLTGEKSWGNYALQTNCIHFGDGGDEGITFGLIFGYQDPEHYYWAGYDTEKESFELSCRTADGFEALDSAQLEFPKYENIPLRVDFSGSRIRFSIKENTLFDVDDGRYKQGQCGLAVSNLQSEKVLFNSISVKSIALESLAEKPLQDLLSLWKGAKLVSPENENLLALIDHKMSIETKKIDSGGVFPLSLKEVTLPYEAVFSLPEEKEGEIHKIGIQLGDMWFPEKIEFLISSTGAEGFQSAGTFQIKPEKNSYQEFDIQPVKGKFLKIKIISSGPSGVDPTQEKLWIENMGRWIYINEIFVYGRYIKGPAKSQTQIPEEEAAEIPEISFFEDFKSGNLDNWKILDDPEAETQKSDWGFVLTELSGISCDHSTEESATLLLTENKDWENCTFSVKVCPTTRKGSLGRYFGLVFGYENADHYYRVGYNKSDDRYELTLFSPQGLELLAFAEMEIPEDIIGKCMDVQVMSVSDRILFMVDSQVVFDIEDRRSRKGRIGIEASSITPVGQTGGGSYLFTDFKATTLDPENPPEKKLEDLLVYQRGAAVIYRSFPPPDYEFKCMIDHSLGGREYKVKSYHLDLTEAKLPQEAVFCFPQGRFAEIHKIGLQLGEENFPKEIKFSISNYTPKSGFEPLVTIRPEQKAESYQEFGVPPTQAKYLKMQISEGFNQEEIEIVEVFVKGYFKERGSQRTAEDMKKEAQLQEKEPNNTLQQAQSLPLSTTLGGEVSQKDQDFYRISLPDIKDEKVEISFTKFGIVTPRFVLQTEEGLDISPSETRATGDINVLTYRLEPGDYFLKITQPEIYVVLVYDDSGSMRVSVPVVKRVLRGYLGNLKAGLQLKLMKYTDDVFMLSDFTRDPTQLKTAAESKVIGAGNTDTFKGLMTAIDEIKVKDGNRAVIAVLDDLVSQRKSSEWLLDYIELWDAILDTGVIFSIIGVQPGWHKKSDYFGNTLNQIFSEIAFATGGQFYHSPSDEQIEQSARTIFEQFTSTVPYLVMAELKKEVKPKPKKKEEKKVKKQGSVQILFEEGAEKTTINNVELILDASNSMWGQIQGESKISIARKVLEQIITGLPEGMRVGLRLYGHRYSLRDKRACQDTELAIPIGPLEKDKMIEIINSIKPKGKTPLVYSVLQAAEDFADIDKGTIILISDGIESCGGNIHSIAPSLKKLGLDLRLHIVGFGIKEADARDELEAIAGSSKGKYLDAKDSKELFTSLEETLRVEFAIVDDKGEVKASGFVGGKSVEIMEGSYTLLLMLAPEPLEMTITVKANEVLQLTLVKEQEKWMIRE